MRWCCTLLLLCVDVQTTFQAYKEEEWVAASGTYIVEHLTVPEVPTSIFLGVK